MRTRTRHYHVASGGVYTQIRHFDDHDDFVGEQWEKKSEQKTESIVFAAYVSPAMCTRIANNYIRYQQLGRFDRVLLRKLILSGKREHYRGTDGRIVYIAHATAIYTSTKVVKIVPPFDPSETIGGSSTSTSVIASQLLTPPPAT
ncbi:MAG TPA: hypothetical protein VLH60_06375 [Sedimentisphaerales bacterium]|nr:hypothetical protein [Sedimentisphaerales bacterium]